MALQIVTEVSAGAGARSIEIASGFSADGALETAEHVLQQHLGLQLPQFSLAWAEGKNISAISHFTTNTKPCRIPAETSGRNALRSILICAYYATVQQAEFDRWHGLRSKI
ncbi:hypothetical protein ABMA32_15120 [Mesorhizobium sp. VNQ89]|uniref:hypothetical protein n=1 Tax=Mesorhizobium quangtriensis TaxID=3157709 RepID=UPI0032B724DA